MSPLGRHPARVSASSSSRCRRAARISRAAGSKRLCRRDPEFPAAIVWTIYYDTPALVSLGEKINSDYLKRKIRVRWYSDLEGRVSGPAFVEAKLRVGHAALESARAAALSRPTRLRGGICRTRGCWRLPLLLRDQGVLGQESWQPMMLIRYRRDRFIEPLTQSRVSLDADISAARGEPAVSVRADLSPLATAVLEVKGGGDELPAALRPLLALGLRKRSFSKFLVVYAHMTRSAIGCLVYGSARDTMQQQLDNLFGALTQGTGPQVTPLAFLHADGRVAAVVDVHRVSVRALLFEPRDRQPGASRVSVARHLDHGDLRHDPVLAAALARPAWRVVDRPLPHADQGARGNRVHHARHRRRRSRWRRSSCRSSASSSSSRSPRCSVRR